MIFLHVFLSIFLNIRLYFYTVRYKFSIKIPSFLWNISKIIQKKSKIFKLISHFKKHKKKQKIILFSCIRPNPKMFSKHIFIKKLHFSHVLKIQEKMNIITSLWSSIMVRQKNQKPFFQSFFLGFRCRL